MILQQPIDAVRTAALLIRCQRQDQVPVGTVALATEADEGGHQNGVVRLHVLRPAPVEIAVLLHELEWIGGPILTASLHYVEVTDNQHRLAGAGAPQARHHVAFAIVRTQHLDIPGRKSGVLQSLRHGFRRQRGAAHRIGSIDFDQFPKNVAAQLARGVIQRRAPQCDVEQ